MRFRAVIETNGKTATGFQVPDEVVAALCSGRRPAVAVTLGGHTYRSTVATMGGRFLLPLSAANRTKAGVAAGDEVDVDVELDTAPREVTVPADLAAALAEDVVVRQRFEGLPFTHRKEYVVWIEDAKKPETRQRRVDKAIEMLREGKTR
jgi:hypothetical protein